MAALLFWILVLVCCGFGAVYGGRDGRRLALVYVLACIATVPAGRLDRDWGHMHLAVLGVDLILLAALLWISLSSRRWFPIWFTGFHVAAICSHLATLLVPSYAPKVYFLLQGLWSLPMLLSFAIGADLDRRGRVRDDARLADVAG